MQDRASFIKNNGESHDWMKRLVLAYLSALPYDLMTTHTTSLIWLTEVEYEGHKWRAIPYASNAVFPRLELISSTTTTAVAMPVDMVITVLSRIYKVLDYTLWETRATLIGLANASIKDQLNGTVSKV